MTEPTSPHPSAQALHHAMSGLAGPLSAGAGTAPDYTAVPRPAAGEEPSVLILGAGVGGLTAAYELGRLGHRCTVLEPQPRTGGRNRTARRGDKLYELDGEGNSPVLTHTCAFDHGLYLNLGPGRIPHHHRRVLKYCTELGVALEPYIMETTANVLHRAGHTPPGRPWRNRRVANDTRGHLAALLSATLTGRDAFTGQLRDLLRKFGDLDEEGEYHGSTRSGYAEPLDVHEFPSPAPPLGLADLVVSEFWKHRFYQPVDHLWQATMFQPVGGMDRIVHALTERITTEYGVTVELGAEVTSVDLTGAGVRVGYRSGGQERTTTADYCVSNIPLPVLKQLELTGFSPEFGNAVTAVGFAPTCKVGWQANRRFWEDDRNQIFGGISFTDHPITQFWYPSHDYFSKTGTLTGAYNFGDNARDMGKRTPVERLGLARDGAVQLHREFLEKTTVPQDLGVSIAWHKVPHQLGGWADWDPADPAHQVAYKQLLQPEGDGRFYVVGDQASPLPGWQEGAMMSAQYVVAQILGLLPRTAPDTVQVPDAVFLTQGL
ncbi:flavin monoamine oxidase family protein [Streptomyces sp. SP18BB07]|uniref:flavin monoamine oxidase family protein n=1 Tax=Streptomyces sp. SP18BB07 TaxID=3002522 RepID=UPI002E787CB1|nr:FAD-dependent oxidoreductase [Streptomyces sp. SP18BB07]MEE1761287.1 FAD-dependent oxidoreductase [Streptomyces sp. SP18BB07]